MSNHQLAQPHKIKIESDGTVLVSVKLSDLTFRDGQATIILRESQCSLHKIPDCSVLLSNLEMPLKWKLVTWFDGNKQLTLQDLLRGGVNAVMDKRGCGAEVLFQIATEFVNSGVASKEQSLEWLRGGETRNELRKREQANAAVHKFLVSGR